MKDKAPQEPIEGTEMPVTSPPADAAQASPPEAQNTEPEGQASPPSAEAAAEATTTVVSPLEAKVQELTTELGTKDSRIAALEAEISANRTANADHRQAIERIRAELTAGLMAAATRYGELARTANPEIPAELITGSSIQEVDAAIASGKAIVQKVKEQLAAQVSPGGQVRAAPDTAGMSPAEKIRYAVAQRKK